MASEETKKEEEVNKMDPKAVDNPTLDPAILKVLPDGAEVVSVVNLAASTWSTTASITVTLLDKSTQKYFLKSGSGSTGRTLMLGEYTATKTIYDALPGAIAKPHAWGKYTESDTYFVLLSFLNIDTTMPPPSVFIPALASLHRITSPNGQYGFSETTCDGAVPHTVAWESSWTVFFANLLRGVHGLDVAANGAWPELDRVFGRLQTYVIPRLLNALTDIRPSLIHGDMWFGNVGTDRDTGKVVFVDASSFYAHNEMEVGLWRWIPEMATCTKVYREQVPPSEPADEWDDRNRLYSLKTKLNCSVDNPPENGMRTRKMAYDDMCYLCEKYAPKDDTVVPEESKEAPFPTKKTPA